MDQDLYDILGVVPSSTMEQIMAEYRAKALQFHPDKNEDGNESEKFKILSMAKKVLTDPQERRIYDQWRNSGKLMGVSFDQWKNLKMYTSMHWATTVDQTPMVEQPTRNQTGQSTSNVQAVADVTAYWRRTQPSEAPAGSLLSKFRNYEI